MTLDLHSIKSHLNEALQGDNDAIEQIQALHDRLQDELNEQLDRECKHTAISMRDGMMRELSAYDRNLQVSPPPEVQDAENASGGPEFMFDVVLQGRSFHVEIFGPPYE